MTPLSEIPLDGRLMRPAKHGWTLDYSTLEGRRVHVRVFAFETGLINGVPYDSPSTLGQEEAMNCLIVGAAKMMKLAEAAEVEKTLKAVAADAVQSNEQQEFVVCSSRQEIEQWANERIVPSPTSFPDAEIREEVTDAAQRVPTSDDGALGTKLPAIRRVLFLDVDGVLNTRPGSLDTGKISLVREIVDATGAAVVISSSWRTVPEQMVRLKRVLSACCIEPIGQTPCFDHSNEPGLKMTYPRWKEVRAWLEENPGVDQYVILDDLADMMTMNARFVRVHGDVGLQPANVEQALLKFRRQAIEAGDVLTPAAERLQEEEEGGADL